ncbi:predicted protein [Sclerotinia sclerotiorum 1980 UF-70]|uniref:Uncharacterized protein n=1 Tax=Sclerotinia sclerotiorum (strain ATCC 18683 / 1980 / Ss-1) TaxID=665079 RepID=A7F7V4_SCLS1|nr:predicted protein [Sclerotinia sclerotiorum 1980 UF-70]EDN98825.1 predicted protein [Sclerotinia sclerotiorum 1980 UF-70]
MQPWETRHIRSRSVLSLYSNDDIAKNKKPRTRSQEAKIQEVHH